MTALIFTVVLVVMVSFLCSLLEAVLLSTRPSVLEAAEAQGSRAAVRLKALRANMERPISAILILNTVSHTAGATVAGALALEALGEHRMAWFSVGLTLAILFLSEILPKTLGAIHWRGLWAILTPLLVWMVRLLAPGVWLCQRFAVLLGAKRPRTGPSESEVLGMVRMAARGGAVSDLEWSLIERVFHLDRITARDIMTPRTVITGVEGTRTIEDVRKEAPSWRFTRVPVWTGDPENVQGYLFAPDLWSKKAQESLEQPVNSIMRQVAFVPEAVRGDVLLQRILDTQVHIFMVVDEYGGLSGLVTAEDVIEELVGREIVGETDPAVDMQELARQMGKTPS